MEAAAQNAGAGEAKSATTSAVSIATSPTISIAQGAVDVIAKQMAKRGTPEASLRVGIRGGGCSGFSYVIEYHDGAPHERDKVLDCVATDGTSVRVLVDPKSLLYLNGSELVWEQSLMRSGFKFTNPNEKSSCGCGSSFTV
jgi:iron-sulfur cluster assembly protein